MQFTAPQARTELVANSTAVTPGKTFSVALHMSMDPGWHSYYINPGESGQATSIKWHLPAGFKAGPIRWPVPERIVVAGVAGYVYQHEAWLVTDITAPSSLPVGHEITIGADANWLLCREACVPQKSKLSLSLPVDQTTSANPAFAPALKGETNGMDSTRLSASIGKKAAVLAIADRLPALTGLQFFPADATYFGADVAQVKNTPVGINLVVPLSRYAPGPPKRMTGILVISAGPAKGAHWIDVKVTEH